jgi:hypothetical protein
MIVCFVDIGGVDDHHRLNFPFIIQITLFSLILSINNLLKFFTDILPAVLFSSLKKFPEFKCHQICSKICKTQDLNQMNIC